MEKPTKNITIVEDRTLINFAFMKYIINPAYAQVHNFPFKNNVEYINPCSTLSQRKLASHETNLILTDIHSNYTKIMKILNEYKKGKKESDISNDMSVVILTTLNDAKENSHALDLGATLVNLCGRERFVIDTLAKILTGETTDKKIGFEKPIIPESKMPGVVSGFGEFSKTASKLYHNTHNYNTKCS